MRIAPATFSDLGGMARAHVAAFPGQFMTQMGRRWLAALYRLYVRSEDGIALVACEDDTGRVVGLVAGGAPSLRTQFLSGARLRYPHVLIWRFLTRKVVRTKMLSYLLGKLRPKRGRRSDIVAERSATLPANHGSLLSICVIPEYRGTESASRLIEAFQDESRRRGYEAIELTVRSVNARAMAFYEKHGWRRMSESEGSFQFVFDLKPA